MWHAWIRELHEWSCWESLMKIVYLEDSGIDERMGLKCNLKK
jgi:hypothetical protein